MALSKDTRVQLTIGTLGALVAAAIVTYGTVHAWLDQRYASATELARVSQSLSDKADLVSAATREDVLQLHKRIDLSNQAADFRQAALDRIESKLDKLIDRSRSAQPPGPVMARTPGAVMQDCQTPRPAPRAKRSSNQRLDRIERKREERQQR